MPLASVQNWLMTRTPSRLPQTKKPTDTQSAHARPVRNNVQNVSMTAAMRGLGDRQRPPARQHAVEPRVAEHQDADEQPGAEDHVRDVDGAQAAEMSFDRVSG